VRVPISFAIPFPFLLKGAHVHFQGEANFTDFDEAGPGTVGCAAPAGAVAERNDPPGDIPPIAGRV
jgi:hypothetical protein